ncbi:MAG: hypothetical protein K8S97_16385 [Anaerolineae bacterium]|nr:hypothetical protein [Anaerolineae bacterium]
MPITLNWVPDTAVLLATYTGVISHADYHAMVQQRLALIEAQAVPFVLVADMGAFEGLQNPAQLPADSSVFQQPTLVAMIIVFPEDLYEKCASAIVTQGAHLRAHIVAQRSQAFVLAEQLPH